MEEAFGKPIRPAFEEDGEDAFRAREAEVVGSLLEEADGGAIALGGGSVLSERVREALCSPHRRLAAGRRARGLAADRPQRPAAWPATPRTSSACWRSGCPSTSRSPTRSCRRGIAAWSSRAMPSLIALTELPAGNEDALGEQRLGRVPGLRRARSARRRLPGRCPERRFCVTDAAVGPLYAERLEPLAGRVEVAAGRDGEDDGRGRAGAARAGSRRDDARGPRGRPRRRCRRRPGRLLRPPLPARRPGRAGADHAGRPGRLGLRRQDRGRPARGQELRRRLPPAGRRPRRHGDARQPARGGAGGGIRRAAQDRPAGGRRPLGAHACARGARSRAACRARLRLRSLQVRGRRRRRARRRPARRAQPRPHGRARDRGGERLRALPPRRGGRARPAGGPAALRRRRGCATRSRRSSVDTGCRSALDPSIDLDQTLAALQRDKKRTAEGVGFVLLAEPGAPRAGQLVDPAKVRAAVEELYR